MSLTSADERRGAPPVRPSRPCRGVAGRRRIRRPPAASATARDSAPPDSGVAKAAAFSWERRDGCVRVQRALLLRIGATSRADRAAAGRAATGRAPTGPSPSWQLPVVRRPTSIGVTSIAAIPSVASAAHHGTQRFYRHLHAVRLPVRHELNLEPWARIAAVAVSAAPRAPSSLPAGPPAALNSTEQCRKVTEGLHAHVIPVLIPVPVSSLFMRTRGGHLERVLHGRDELLEVIRTHRAAQPLLVEAQDLQTTLLCLRRARRRQRRGRRSRAPHTCTPVRRYLLQRRRACCHVRIAVRRT